MIEDSCAVLLMFGKEIEMWRTGSLIKIVVLPNPIFKLDDWVLNHDSDRNFHISWHLVGQTSKKFALAFSTLTQSFSNSLDAKDIGLFGDGKLNSIACIVVGISIANFEDEIGVQFTLRVEIDEKFLLWVQRKDIIPGCFGGDLLVVRVARFKDKVWLFGWGY